jgi:hypothetical protein
MRLPVPVAAQHFPDLAANTSIDTQFGENFYAGMRLEGA